MSRFRGPAVVLAVVALALIGAGCGDDEKSGDSEGSGGGSALTKEQFLEQGNAICAAGNAELEAEGAGLGTAPTPGEIEDFALRELVPNIQNQLDELRTLTPPAGDEEQVEEILTAAEEGVAAIKEDPARAFDDAGADPFDTANQLAEDYGLVACGS